MRDESTCLISLAMYYISAHFITARVSLSDLSNVVKKRVCDMRWEVRDSTVEFLGHVADIRVLKSAMEVCSASEALLGGCCATALLREALQDTESYVRASAVSALAKTLMHSWQQGAALSQEEVSDMVNTGIFKTEEEKTWQAFDI